MVARPVGFPGSIPELPVQCSCCCRWVGKSQLAVMPVGASPLCSLCSALGEVGEPRPWATITLDKEEKAVVFLSQAFVILCGLPVSPVGAPSLGSFSYALDLVHEAICQETVSLDKEEEILTLFFKAHEALCGR